MEDLVVAKPVRGVQSTADSLMHDWTKNTRSVNHTLSKAELLLLLAHSESERQHY